VIVTVRSGLSRVLAIAVPSLNANRDQPKGLLSLNINQHSASVSPSKDVQTIPGERCTGKSDQADRQIDGNHDPNLSIRNLESTGSFESRFY
jgi:hypothetical protein